MSTHIIKSSKTTPGITNKCNCRFSNRNVLKKIVLFWTGATVILKQTGQQDKSVTVGNDGFIVLAILPVGNVSLVVFFLVQQRSGARKYKDTPTTFLSR
jgi:TRAP-type C4-dicarboxylate transport system permease small subunit